MLTTAKRKSTCDELHDAMAKRGIAVAGASRHESRKATAFWRRQANAKIEALLRERLGKLPTDAQGRVKRTPVATAARQAKIDAQVRAILNDAGRGIYALHVKPRLLDFARRSVDWTAGDLLGGVPLNGWTPRRPAAASVRGVVTQQGMDGRTIRQWYRDLAADVSRRVSAEIERGIAANERPDEILRRIRGTLRSPSGPMAHGLRMVDVLTTSAVQHVHVRSFDEVLSRNADVIAGGIWTTMLDVSVCPLCVALAAEESYGPPGFYPNGIGPRPLAHPRCRCYMTPTLLPLAKMAPSVRRANQGLPQDVLECLQGALSGRPSINEWVAGLSRAELVQQFGRGRANLLARGEIRPRDLIDRFLRIRRLDDL